MAKTTQFDEEKWPQLTEFRDACLDGDTDAMSKIAEKGYDWYDTENPSGMDLELLSKIFQAQHFSAEGDLKSLSTLISGTPELIHLPWTAQQWLPLSQAISGGHEDVVEFLLAHGANPSATIGGLGQEGTIAQMAEQCGNERIRTLINQARQNS